MRLSVGLLVLGYVLSQFYRAILPVLSPYLARDLGVTPGDLAWASGLWFVAFALAQLPIGWALDHIGPRWTSALPLGVLAGGGALVFAAAPGPEAVIWAMVMIGAGCAPVLVATYYIYARHFRAALFGTLAGITVGVGSLGNIAASVSLAWAVTALGWRATMAAIAGLTILVALAVASVIRDPARPGRGGDDTGRLRDLLRLRAFWLIAPMMMAGYAPAADIRALWVAPHLAELYGQDAIGIGRASLVMGLAMIAGNFLYGPADRLLGSHKWGIMIGSAIVLAALLALAFAPRAGLGHVTLLFDLLGFAGAAYPAVMAHGRSFFPPHLVGRGVTLLTFAGMGGTGLLQVVSGRVHAAFGPDPTVALTAVYIFFAVVVAASLAAYAFSPRRGP